MSTTTSPRHLPDPVNQDGRYPRPQLLREHWSDLTGDWDFAFAQDLQSANPGAVVFDRQITVPFPPESPASGIGDTGYHPVVWYRRTFGPTAIQTSGHGADRPTLLLHFGAVDWAAEVWLNGTFLGRHEGGQTPFWFDISDAATTDADNELIVRAVDDPHDVSLPRGKQDWREDPHSIWYHRTTGIWQPVWLESVPQQYIRELAWEADVPNAAIDLEMTLNAGPLNGSWAHITITYEHAVLAESRQLLIDQTTHLRIGLPAQRNGQQYEELLWSPDHPRLISARIELELASNQPGDLLASGDAVASYFGLRSVEATERAFLLNDRPIYMRSVLSQNYWPESHLAAPSPDALRREVELIKALGFNAARVHQKAEDPRFLFWADRLGLLVWGETASAYDFNPRAIALLTNEWVELVRRDRSHPSIVAWVPLNESWGVQHISHDPRQQAFSRAIADLTRAVDGTRPVISNDGWEHTDSDIWTVHDYDGNPQSLAARYGSTEAVADLLAGFGPAGRRMSTTLEDRDQPVMLTEFGGVSFIEDDIRGAWGYSSAENASQFEEQVTGLLRAAQSSPVLAGFCYTQLTDTGQETNGLLRADRSPKIPVEAIREAVLMGDGNSNH
ncbi:glycoside hydrolase family 2 [Agromyces tardus]|uniref:Glycoside hydrolase family 2 n=1 Tax=Agromyces tardus TaxID=2583849 RepID=A0A3M8AIW0_9MICO|nr:glycoside hydrolase family 2 TIM barrel-domain containing protein [Agromyces tardus]RNB51131.1 glycoside hydrolase family 2 [Agromyces tardus]